MSLSNNIFLIGPMGAGKTTIGRQLAKTLSLRFIDSDHEIESRTGVTISLIFELEGEEGFRRREKAILNELANAQSGMVMATGGGAVLDPENRALLSARGLVVYLRADMERLLERTGRNKKRPLLQTDDPGKKLKEIMEIREPLYREIADLVVDTGSRPIRSVVKEIIDSLPSASEAQ
jgi:3-dehydroquinate synthase